VSHRTEPQQPYPAAGPAQGGVNQEQRSAESGHSRVPKLTMVISQTPLEDLPVQLSAWRRLWTILLAPATTTDPGTGEADRSSTQNANAASAERAESGVNG
jgi:hypothetical protein